jgi:hypothetical protein
MNSAIIAGIFWHLVGAASAACFYAPFKQVKKWSWETMWSVGGVMSWLILPWAVSAVLLPHFWAYYTSFSASQLLPVFLFGAMWGVGNINYGLTMRYLGMSMGIGIAIGITLVVGTLMTPLTGVRPGAFQVIQANRHRQHVLLAQDWKKSGLDQRRFAQTRYAVEQRQRITPNKTKQILDLVTTAGEETAITFGEGGQPDPGMLRVGPISAGIVHWAAALRRRSRTMSVSALMNSGFASPPFARV